MFLAQIKLRLYYGYNTTNNSITIRQTIDQQSITIRQYCWSEIEHIRNCFIKFFFDIDYSSYIDYVTIMRRSCDDYLFDIDMWRSFKDYVTIIRRLFVTDSIDFRYLTDLLLNFIRCFVKFVIMRFVKPVISIDDSIENQFAFWLNLIERNVHCS